ncbi:MAG: hypothetical protein Q9166_007365 [cf. Caloplaca sp. 2 TL-2023]
MASKPFNVAIIGYGAAAKVFHIPLIEVVPELKLYAIVQRHPTPENDASKAHPGIKSYRSAEEMVKDSSVDMVVVATTPATHFELAKLALKHWKHVLVEKPFVPTLKEADELIALSKKNKRVLSVYQNRRYDQDFLTIQSLIQTQTLGRIIEFESHFDRYKPSIAGSKPWKTRSEPGGGAIYDLGAHMIDQIYVLFGLPRKITAFLGSQRVDNPGNYDDAFAVVSAEVEQMRFWFHEDIQEAHLTAGKKPGDTGFGIESPLNHGTLTILSESALIAKPYPTTQPTTSTTYAAIYTQFAHAIAGKGDVSVKPEDAREVIRLIELAKQSSEEGRTVDV